MKPGNAGGGKDPDFWYAFEEGKVKVIGDEPANTDYHPGPSEKAVSRGEEREHAAQMTLDRTRKGLTFSVSSTRTRWTIVTARPGLLHAPCVPRSPGSPDVAV